VFVKVFDTMFDGTLATKGPWQAMVTFQQFLILADLEGIVDMTPQAIARRTTIPLKIIMTGIAALEQPDPESRSPARDGRRIVRISESRSWGWEIVNYLQYRAIRDEEGRREYMRLYQQNRRARQRVNNVNSGKDASTDIAEVSPSRSRGISRRKEEPLFTAEAANGFDAFWLAYPRKQKKRDSAKTWKRLNPDEALQATIIAAVKRARESKQWRREGGQYIPLAPSYINGRRWEDEPRNGDDSSQTTRQTHQWWLSESATIAKGRELGIEARRGELMPDLRARISAALGSENSQKQHQDA
jgi:hypothetical protein